MANIDSKSFWKLQPHQKQPIQKKEEVDLSTPIQPEEEPKYEAHTTVPTDVKPKRANRSKRTSETTKTTQELLGADDEAIVTSVVDGGCVSAEP